eukprot:1142497-Alexandrium_andersonii.AAC.1
MPAVGCSAPPCLLAVPRFRVAAVRRRWHVVCAVLRRLSARPRPGLRLVDGGAPVSALPAARWRGLGPRVPIG